VIEIHLGTDDFVSWLHRAMEEMEARSRQALGQSVAVALQHARATTAFKDQTGALRRSLTRGQKGPWTLFLKAGAKHALFVEVDTKPHRIEARRAKTLRFVTGGGVRFARSVQHGSRRARARRHDREGGRAVLSLIARAHVSSFPLGAWWRCLPARHVDGELASPRR
jgi:hypothetical protein